MRRGLLLLPLLAACETPQPDPIDVLVESACEFTNPVHCMLPWPSSRWLEADATTETGFRLAYEADALPLNRDDDGFDVSAYNRLDGFSPASQILTAYPEPVDLEAMTGVAIEGAWDLSLQSGSPTVIVDLQTGERVAHMVEIDARGREDSAGAPVLLYLRPSQRLQENRAYGVALRDVVLQDGSTPSASPVFAALRDGVITTSTEIEAARPGYEAMFAKLTEAGVDRAGLQAAWWFNTASGDAIRGPLMAMRDDAMQRVPRGGGSCTVTEVQDEVSDETLRRIDGTFEVPLYMTGDRTGERLALGADGLPEYQGTAQAPFTLLVPRSLVADQEQGRLLAFGHGLMGSGSGEGGGGFLRRLGNRYGLVTVATDWWGMSDADLVTVGRALSDVTEFPATGERLAQGVINNLVMARAFTGACKALPELQYGGRSVIGDEPPYWLGISQGGIMGGTVTALSPDIERSALLVGGMSYPVMIGRSVDFTDYEIIFRTWYRKRIDREILMNMMITMWDIAEPNAWLSRIQREPLADNPPKQVLYQVERDDSHVPILASDMAVREMGIPLLTPSSVDVWGVPTATAPTPSAYVYYDLNAPFDPPGNWLRAGDNGVHGDQRYIDAAMEQMGAFWRPDGVVTATCDGGCDPE